MVKKSIAPTIKVTPCKYAGHPDLYNKRYDAQNILIRQYNFPAAVYVSDELASNYSDRIHTTWENSRKWWNKKKKRKEGGLDFKEMTNREFMAWGRIIFASWLKHIDRKLTGLRVLRYTNAGSGHPTLLVICYSRNPLYPKVPLYSDSFNAPNIIQEEGPGILRDNINFGAYDKKRG